MVFYYLNPLLAIYTKLAPRIIEGLYRRLGVGGCLSLPFVTLATEKVSVATV